MKIHLTLKSFVLNLKKAKTLFKPWDAMAYGVVIIIMVSGLAGMRLLMVNGRDRLAIVEMDGIVLNTVYLEQDMEAREIRVDAGEGRYNTVLIGYDFVEVLESNCPDQVCVGWGRIRYSGQTIVCLPFKIVIRVVGRIEETPIDEITW